MVRKEGEVMAKPVVLVPRKEPIISLRRDFAYCELHDICTWCGLYRRECCLFGCQAPEYSKLLHFEWVENHEHWREDL